MHSVNISAIFLATTAVAAAGRTFFSVPVGLDKGAVSEAFSSRGIQGFDPSARPNADGLYTANNNNNNNNNNEHRMSEDHVDKPARMEPQQYRIESMAEQPMMPYHPQQQQHEELEQQQPIMFHPVAALETFAEAPLFPPSAPRPASIIAPPNIAAMSGPPPGRPVAVPLAPAREPRPGLLVAPPVVVNPSVQISPAIRPNPPMQPPQPPPPPQIVPAQPAVAAAAIPPSQMPASVVSAAAAPETTIIQNNAILTSTVLVMATAPRPPPQPMAASSVQPMVAGKSDAMQGIHEDDVFEDEGGDVATKPTALSVAPQQQQQQQQPPPATQPQSAVSSISIAATPTEQSSRSMSVESASKPTGPVKLKPLMFAKANMSVFKPEDIDKFTFPSAELSVNMAGLGRDSSANLPHVASATGFAGSMPNNEHAKPTASVNSKVGASAAKATGGAAPDTVGAAPDVVGTAPDVVGVASISKPRQSQNSQESELPASSAAAPRGENESSAVPAIQQEFLGAAVLLAVIIHVAVAMF
ncbi:hypothetical protein GGI09_004059 [Coemansia sp. S100]|nr:hypothetical protein GGI14_002658 [Coemansia sp. S680]KAJ2097020.1 hypothetical protein GGI09_004059 [Coemansia sp. S100]KAJ2106878.1 hypothetical protein GGI16_001757 [Coemansia sp. S142-1]